LNGIIYPMDYSLYIHIPFCQRRCYYCDFNTYAGMEHLIPDYISALIKEFRIVFRSKPGINLRTIYFGGGTPSIISLAYYQEVFNVLSDVSTISEDCEISLEANPGTLTPDYLDGLIHLGFNRISIGVQSTNPFDLVRLGRIHDVSDVLDSVYFSRRAGFTNISLDMIFGLPWQDLSSWKQSLLRAIDLKPQHFSLYSLIIEPETPLFGWFQKGLIKPPDQDLEGDMFELAMELLEEAGYEHYEISNWAIRDSEHDYRCRHNMQYWLNQPYLGMGAGAHGYAVNVRTVNEKRIQAYIERIQEGVMKEMSFPASPAAVSAMNVGLSTQMSDFMMLGLRLVEDGVTDARFKSCYTESMLDIYAAEIQSLVNNGLIEWVGERLRLTPRGVMVANQVFMAFV